MAESIMQSRKRCYITGAEYGLHKHHIFSGLANRRKSEEWGCWVWLRADWHNMSSYGVHTDRKLNLRLRQECQAEFERRYGHQKFMEVFGKNYL